MNIGITKLLGDLGFKEDPFYWGKRLVRALPQPGAFKSHAVVANWAQPHAIRIELRAGLSGRQLAGKDLTQYPLQLQSETFFELAVTESEDDEGKGDQKGKTGSGGGKGLKKRADERLSGFFTETLAEKVPDSARLTRGVVMGMEIGRDALGSVFSLFCQQVKAAKVMATDLLAAAGKAITRYTPPPFMAPRGDETQVYRYDRAKNEVMFGVAPT